MSQILTANRLAEGDVVFWGDNQWQPLIGRAEVALEPAEAAALLALGTVEAQANRVVEPYLIDVEFFGDQITPRHYREAIRMRGPSVRTDLGKQAA